MLRARVGRKQVTRVTGDDVGRTTLLINRSTGKPEECGTGMFAVLTGSIAIRKRLQTVY